MLLYIAAPQNKTADIINCPEMKHQIPAINIEKIIMFIYKLFIILASLKKILIQLFVRVNYTELFIVNNMANNK
mgnify:CR=1 FL=1